MPLTVRIKTDNAAFQGDSLGPELARILREIAEKLEGGRDGGPVMDANGNRVGAWSMGPK